MRTFLMSTLILITTVGSLLSWQWHAFSEKQERLSSKNEKTAYQTLYIEDTGSALLVTQEINGLPQGTYTIVNPKATIVEWTATAGKNIRKGQQISKSESDKLTFNYSLKREQGRSAVLNQWFFKLDGVRVIDTVVTVSDKSKRTGSWIAGAPLQLFSKQKHLDYYAFKSKGEAFPLLYHDVPLQEKGVNGITIYSEDLSSKLAQKVIKDLEKIKDVSPQTILVSNRKGYSSTEGLHIVRSFAQAEQLAYTLSTDYLSSIYPFETREEQWLQIILANLSDNKLEGHPKAIAMTEAIQTAFGENQLSLFMKKVNHHKQQTSLSASILDQYLSELSGSKITFFEMNVSEKEGFVPFFFEENRPVLFEETEIKKARIIYLNGNRYYGLKTILPQLGYKVSEEKSGVSTISKKGLTYNYYLGETKFSQNGMEYALLSQPITKLDGMIFMQENWFEKFFSTTIHEDQTKLILK